MLKIGSQICFWVVFVCFYKKTWEGARLVIKQVEFQKSKDLVKLLVFMQVRKYVYWRKGYDTDRKSLITSM